MIVVLLQVGKLFVEDQPELYTVLSELQLRHGRDCIVGCKYKLQSFAHMLDEKNNVFLKEISFTINFMLSHTFLPNPKSVS